MSKSKIIFICRDCGVTYTEEEEKLRGDSITLSTGACRCGSHNYRTIDEPGFQEALIGKIMGPKKKEHNSKMVSLGKVRRTCLDQCEAILLWAEKKQNKFFDSSFVESVMDQIEEGRTISSRQEDAIERIYNKFKIGDKV